MIQYTAFTIEACIWLSNNQGVMDALRRDVISGDLERIGDDEISIGPLRIAQCKLQPGLFVVWHKEYISGMGSESFGIIKTDGQNSIKNNEPISKQVFERQIYVISQRLQGLKIDGSFIHRSRENGFHTCLAGRGEEARHLSIIYYEAIQGGGSANDRSIIIVGPSGDYNSLLMEIALEKANLERTYINSNETIESPGRKQAGSDICISLRSSLPAQEKDASKFSHVQIKLAKSEQNTYLSFYDTMSWSYDEWISSNTLNDSQKRLLSSDVLLSHPVRVTGPAGSGKTLLMQLLAIRYLKLAEQTSKNTKIIYVVHNNAMSKTATDRFIQLGADEFLTSPNQQLKVSTLAEYGQDVAQIPSTSLIERDASDAKKYQLDVIKKSLRNAIASEPIDSKELSIFSEAVSNENLFDALAYLISTEISSVIKGRGLIEDKKKYVNSESSFSRFHKVMNTTERGIVFKCFEIYHEKIFEELEMLDSDDLALTLTNYLRTPLWRLKRKIDGFDLIFVDEAQLFNENERRVFPLLSSGLYRHTPIALAMDEAQDIHAFSTAGLSTLGITDIENENLPSNHRSTREIIDLSFFFIQKTTDLFSSEFPEFEGVDLSAIPANHKLSDTPRIINKPEDQPDFGRFVLNEVKRLRASNIRQIAVVCHAETYWKELVDTLSNSQLPIHIINQRGEKISPDQPLVIITRPNHIGGQEFDAVLSVGLEQGVTPLRIIHNPPLTLALEQQHLRELYLVISRSRYQYHILINTPELPNSIVMEAKDSKLIK